MITEDDEVYPCYWCAETGYVPPFYERNLQFECKPCYGTGQLETKPDTPTIENHFDESRRES